MRRYKIGEAFEPREDDSCDACGFEHATLKVFGYPPSHRPAAHPDAKGTYLDEDIMILCNFCASTFCSAPIEHPTLFGHERHVLGAIAYGVNAILLRLEKGEKP